MTPEKDMCTLPDVFAAISGKWKPYIIWHMSIAKTETVRYGELRRMIHRDVTNKVFTQQLKELENDGLIERREYDEKPLRVEYSLTPQAHLLIPVLYYLRDWGASYGRHAAENALERTRGSWSGGEISYDYHDENGMGVSITYDVNRCSRRSEEASRLALVYSESQ